MTRYFRNLLVASILLFNGSVHCLAGDKWIDSSGTKTVEADFVKLDGIQLTLKNSDGKEIVIPLYKLDSNSRLLARRLAKLPRTPATTDSTVTDTESVATTSKPTAKESFDTITNSIGMKLVLIPAGTFTMGSPVGEKYRFPKEMPHEVTISKSYYLGVYEVTQHEYEKVMGNNPSKFKGATNPVEMVSWEEAVSFCKKLSELPEEKAAGRLYRLPTEAEWEYACRAGSTTSYSFGDTAEALGEYAWFGDFKGTTHPVGEKKPNRWGLYDMHGNVFEWCQDWNAAYPPDASTDPQGPNGGSIRVLRGGCWDRDAARCRSAFRYSNDPSIHTGYYGFRLALSPSVK
jgi:formylglycine-generating enzyme required for sulfatase activity